jgi:hypothetical protein
MYRTKFLFLMLAALCLWGLARAENLNEKFGPSWTCNYITAGSPLFDVCKPCMDSGQDFFRTGSASGYCVPRNSGGGSTADTPKVAPQSAQWCNDAIRSLQEKLRNNLCHKTMGSDDCIMSELGSIKTSCPYVGRADVFTWALNAIRAQEEAYEQRSLQQQEKAAEEAAVARKRQQDELSYRKCLDALNAIKDDWNKASDIDDLRRIDERLRQVSGNGTPQLASADLCFDWRDKVGDWVRQTLNTMDSTIRTSLEKTRLDRLPERNPFDTSAKPPASSLANSLPDKNPFETSQGNTNGGTPACSGTGAASTCVTLQQLGVRGSWHDFKLVNACNSRFDVRIYSCLAEWAGGCSVNTQNIGPCETSGGGESGNQSWNEDAQLR